MQVIIDKCNEILSRFDEQVPLGTRWHTMTHDDFVKLVQCVKKMAEHIQREGEEID